MHMLQLIGGLGLCLILVQFSQQVAADSLLFLSTQLNPIEEAEKMRRVILKDYPGEVDFRPYDR